MKRSQAFSQRYQIRSACARCHRLKSKCEYEDPAFVSCKRCFNLGIECSTEEDPTAKRARKRPPKPSRLVRLLTELNKELTKREEERGESGGGAIGGGRTIGGGAGGGEKGDEQLKGGVEGTGIGTGVEAGMIGMTGTGKGGEGGTEVGQGDHELVCNLFASVMAKGEQLGLSLHLANVLPHDARARYAFFVHNMRPSYPILRIPARLVDYDVCLGESPELLSACIYATTIHSHHKLQSQNQNENQSQNQRQSQNQNFFQNLQSQNQNQNHNQNRNQPQNSFRKNSVKSSSQSSSQSPSQSPSSSSQNGSDWRLKAYIDKSLAQLVFVKANDFSSHLVTALMVLSLWNVPPGEPGHYKSQMDLLIAYSVSMCIDIGPDSDLDMLRSFMSVFCCCGSLSFSLSRFRFVSWSKNHSLAVDILSSTSVSEDAFLCAYSRLMVEGLKLMDSFNEVSLSANSVASEKELADALSHYHETTPLEVVMGWISEFQDRICLENPHFFDQSVAELSDYAPRFLMLVSYHQIMTMAYEHVLGLCVFHVQMHQLQKSHADYSEPMVTTIHNIGQSCSMILACFGHVSQTGCLPEYPTLMYYRALSALVALVRVSILVKSDIVKQHLKGCPEVVSFDLQGLYGKVARVFELHQSQSNPVQERFTIILKRIEAWVVAIESDTLGSGALKISLPKGQEVEYLKTPSGSREKGKEKEEEENTVQGERVEKIEEGEREKMPEIELGKSDFDVVSDSTIQDIFKELEDDIERFLNPFNDSPFRADELFGFEP